MMFAEIRKDYLDAGAVCPLAFVLCTIGRSPTQGTMRRPEGFVYHHVIWVEQGEGLFVANGQTRRLGPGEGMFCRKDVPHSYEAGDHGLATRWVTFLGGEGVLEYYRVPEAFFFHVTPALSASTTELGELCAGNSTIISRSAAGYTWLTEWLGTEFAPNATLAFRVLQYLETHFAEPVTLDEVAEAVQMNRYSLCRQFAKEQKHTVMEQLKRIRIAKAKQFLRYTTFSIEEIGKMSGYADPSYFGKLFRMETGRSPGEYRREVNC